jgi:hypothetical protein
LAVGPVKLLAPDCEKGQGSTNFIDAHLLNGHPVPIEARPHVGACLPHALQTNRGSRLEIIRPRISRERKRVAAVMHPFKGRPF